MSDPIRIGLIGDISDIRLKAKEVREITDDVTSVWARTYKRIKEEAREVIYSIRSVVGLFRSVLRYFGISLNPVQEAVVGAIMTSLTAVLAIHRSLEAGTLGLAGIVTVGLSALSVALSVAAIAQAILGINEAKEQTERGVALMTDLESMIHSFLWVR